MIYPPIALLLGRAGCIFRPDCALINPVAKQIDRGRSQFLARGRNDYLRIQSRHITDQQALGAFSGNNGWPSRFPALKSTLPVVQTQSTHLNFTAVAGDTVGLDDRL